MKSWHHEFHFSKTLSVHDDVRKKCFRRNLKPHCIHICKVNITILCVIRYQKFTGVKLCLKYFNGNRNELQNLNRNMMKIIHVYVHREQLHRKDHLIFVAPQQPTKISNSKTTFYANQQIRNLKGKHKKPFIFTVKSLQQSLQDESIN